jgi:hypothetical protein
MSRLYCGERSSTRQSLQTGRPVLCATGPPHRSHGRGGAARRRRPYSCRHHFSLHGGEQNLRSGPRRAGFGNTFPHCRQVRNAARSRGSRYSVLWQVLQCAARPSRPCAARLNPASGLTLPHRLHFFSSVATNDRRDGGQPVAGAPRGRERPVHLRGDGRNLPRPCPAGAVGAASALHQPAAGGAGKGSCRP